MSEISRRNFLKGAALGATSIMTVGMAACSGQAAEDGQGAKEPSEKLFMPGKYYGIGQGRGGDITAEVVLGESTIEEIKVIAHDETPIISDAPLSRIPQQVIKHQSVNVDSISHATSSSIGILNSIKDAILNSGFDVSRLQEPFDPDSVAQPPMVESDIAIIGGGCCGMAAAIRAAQLGVPVMLFEQSAHLGGDALLAEGWSVGSGTLMQAAAGEQDSAEQCWQDFIDLQDTKSEIWWDRDLSYRLVTNTGKTIDWLDQYIGARFDNRELTYGTYGGGAGLAHRIHFHDGGLNLIKPMVNKVNEGIVKGLITVFYESQVTRVVTDESGAVSGLEVKNRAGEITQYPFKAVLVATGGYHYNRDMVEKYYGPNMLTGGGSTATGSGFALCEDLGAETTNMSALNLVYAGGIPPKAGVSSTITHFAYAEYPGIIWVDIHGKRNFNETASKLLSHAAWNTAEQYTMNIVFPASRRLKYSGIIQRPGAQEAPLTPSESWAVFDDLLAEGKYVFEADSPEELAKKLGIDETTTFADTIAEINACAVSGEPDSLGRIGLPSYTGKLYGIKTFTILHNTFGAVKRNGDLQVIDKDGKPIEGLWAAGELCGINLVTPPATANIYGGGVGVGGCTSQGRVAAEIIISRLTGGDTELASYVFEGDPQNYDISIYDSGDYLGKALMFEK
ncbi:MAG: FAD-binding protein [Coriobacteriales bacterium]|jgi:succinate dehydrogenase/fumarate reductase flavoprotein subunit/uncharacterized protein with FMN-binding domain|nr:FAD-binding protein [Coriobacteriales bacterium]